MGIGPYSGSPIPPIAQLMKLLLPITILALLPALAPAGSTVPELPPPPPVAPAKPPAGIPFLEKVPPPPAPRAEFPGTYWCYQEGTLHFWEFRDDHTFVHTWTIAPAASKSEIGAFHLNSAGDFVLLEITSPDAKSDIRRTRVQFIKDGLLLNGVELKRKYW